MLVDVSDTLVLMLQKKLRQSNGLNRMVVDILLL